MISRAHLVGLVLIFLLAFAPAAEEKKLAVYTPQTTYFVQITDHDGHEYVSVTDLLDPLGQASLVKDGKRWKLRLEAGGKANDAEFTENSNDIKIRGKKNKLSQPFWTANQRGHVPLAAAAALVSQLTAQTAQLHESGRRLFVGGVGTTYKTEVQKGTPPRIVLHFTAPVNPTVATEPGRVRLTFTREPLLSSGENAQTFDDPTVQSVVFTEMNGAAELTFKTTAPVLVNFGDANKTIALVAPPAPAKPAVAANQPSASPPTPTPVAPQASASAPVTPVPAKMIVIIDPAHGGEDLGATLAAGLFEKDVTLAIARRVRANLDQRGIVGYLPRDGDATMSFDQRAIAANGSRGVLYVSIHVSSTGSRVRLFTSRLAGSVSARGFLPWNKAQANSLNQSHSVAASMITEFESRQIHAIPYESGMRPLRNIAKPGVAIEIAPPTGTVEGLTSPLYQESVASAIAASVANLRGMLEASR